jgi:hypothetical protein
MNILRAAIRPSLYAAAATALVFVLAACASTPSPTESSHSAASANTAHAAAASSPTETPAPASKLITQADLVKRAWQDGLPVHVRISNGDPVYCWSENKMGSMIPSTYCLTQGQLQTLLVQREQARQIRQNQAATRCANTQYCQ